MQESRSLALARPWLGEIVTVRVDRPLGSRHPGGGFLYTVNYLGPVCTAATVHLSAAVPNLAWMEVQNTRVAEGPGSRDDAGVFPQQVWLDGTGYPVPDEPGLGVDVNEEMLQEPFQFYELPHLYKRDGSYTNW